CRIPHRLGASSDIGGAPLTYAPDAGTSAACAAVRAPLRSRYEASRRLVPRRRAADRRARRRRDVDLRQLPERQGREKIWIFAGREVALGGAALLRAAGGRLLRLVRLTRWPGDDEPPLRA